jgi:hypothetical protein
MEDEVMSANDEKLYDGYPTQELIARAHFAEIERNRREREEEAKRQILELEDIVLYQPNGFAD